MSHTIYGRNEEITKGKIGVLKELIKHINSNDKEKYLNEAMLFLDEDNVTLPSIDNMSVIILFSSIKAFPIWLLTALEIIGSNTITIISPNSEGLIKLN